MSALINNPENPNSASGPNQKRKTDLALDGHRGPDPEEADGSNQAGAQRGLGALGGQLQQIPESETRCEQGESSDHSSSDDGSDNNDVDPASP